MLEIAQMVSLYLWHSRFLWRMMRHSGWKHWQGLWGLNSFSFLYALTWGDTLNGEEMTWFLHERCHNSTPLEIEVPQAGWGQGQRNGGESRRSCLMVRLVSPGDGPPIVIFLWNIVGSLKILSWLLLRVILGLKWRGFHLFNIMAHPTHE